MALRRTRRSPSAIALILLLSSGFWSALAESPYFRYERSVSVPEGVSQACAVLDAPVFPHAAPYLKDLRLSPVEASRKGEEVPYAITLSEPVEPDIESAQVQNLTMHGRAIAFDLKMPPRAYTDVDLDLAGKDFVATAIVRGDNVPGSGSAHLGEFTLFDLTMQHLGRGTTLHLAESHYPILHVTLLVTASHGGSTFVPSVAMVLGAAVPPSREAQSLFTAVAETHEITQEGNLSVAHFVLPQRLPVERISVVLAPAYKENFSRAVRIDDRRAGDPVSAGESFPGTIQRAHLTEAGQEIDQQQLSVVATLGANLQGPADVQVSVDNAGEPPLPITAIRLEMRERRLCFDARLAQGGATLFYGDPALSVSPYAYAPVFVAGEKVAMAQMGPERANSAYRARPSETLPLERRQQLLWACMLIVVSTTAMAVFFSSKQPR